MKANPSVYIRAAELVDSGDGSRFSCCAITNSLNEGDSDFQFRHRSFYATVLGGDIYDSNGYGAIFALFNDRTYPDGAAKQAHRVFALLFMAEFCRGMDLP